MLFRTLTVLWVFPSFGALWILGSGLPRWRGIGTWQEALARVRLEDWVALVLLALLTVIPHFVDPPKNAEAKGATLPAAEKQDPQETPKEPPTKAGTEPVAKGPAVKAPPGKGDILDKLGENGTKTVSPKVNPLDKKDDDLLKDIK